MNSDALIAWMYVFNCIYHDQRKSRTDPAFTRFMLDLKQAYPDEYETLIGFIESLGKTNHE